jgi:hypothetical protein
MKTKLLTLIFLLAGISAAQTSASNSNSSSASELQITLQRIEQTSQAAALDLARLRPDKWKTDGDIKNQAQANADSISRNLTSALPTLISGVRTAPQSMAANFKLYRNLNALYDVFEGLAESAGAFGSKQEFEALSRHVQDVDAFRRTFGDYMETLAAAKDTELARARTAMPSGTQATRPKKIIVDNDPAPKTSKKKR